MRHRSRRLATVVTLVVLVLGWAAPAHAVGNVDAAKRAGAYVAAQVSAVTDAGGASDALLALAAAGDPALAPQAATLATVLRSNASAYAAKSPEAAAKLAITAVALGLDPKNLGGVDLVAAVKTGLRADGSFGAQPGPYASGLGMVAFTRLGEPVPPAMLQYLVKLANPDGGFGYALGQASDADNTGMALLGLSTQTDSISARDASLRATAWAIASQLADGSWKGYNPINSTAVMASALQAVGQPQPKAVQFLVGQQLPDGSLPDSGKANLLATEQGALLLGDTSYLTVKAPTLVGGAIPSTGAASATTSAPSSGPPSTASASPTPGQTSASTPSASPTATATPGKPLDDGNNLLWVLLPILLLGLLIGGGYYLFGPPSRAKDAPDADASGADGPPTKDVPATPPPPASGKRQARKP